MSPGLEGHGLSEAGYPPLSRVLVLSAEHEVLAARVTQAEHLVTRQTVVSIGVLKIYKCLSDKIFPWIKLFKYNSNNLIEN